MNFRDILLNPYRRLKLHRWEIGLSETALSDVVNGEPLSLHWIKLPFKDRWFADPFILDVTNDNIVILAEEFSDQVKKGRIAQLVIDRKSFNLKSWEIILELPTHLSFPSIIRIDGKILVCPENSESGELHLYEYLANNKIRSVCTLSKRRLTDAIFTDFFGEKMFFATEFPNDNGNVLDVYLWNEKTSFLEMYGHMEFKEHIARMAGDFFAIGNKIYRPAQESNIIYGHAVVIQEIEKAERGWRVREVRRLYSQHSILKLGMHTFNHYKGFIAIDVKGYRHPILGSTLESLVNRIKELL